MQKEVNKTRFFKLLKFSAKPLPKVSGKGESRKNDDYNDKQTRSNKSASA